MKIFIVSLGCPKNLTDSEEMAGRLIHSGHSIVFEESGADVILVNTCGFIGPAVKESIEELKRVIRLKKAGKIKKVIAAGCLVQREKEKFSKEFKGIDAFLGVASADKIEEALGGMSFCAPLPDDIFSPAHRARLTLPHSAYLKIADGCDNRCAYCTIPSIRGRYRSKSVEDVIAEAKALASSGAREISLVAQDTTLYGIDLYGKAVLPELLKKLTRVKGVEWIRLMYAYPEKITRELLSVMAQEPKICRYIDMPIQHISDRILKAMNRRSDARLIYEKISLMRKIIPGIAIRTNFIVGFPGETETDFKKLKKFVSETGLYSVGVFAYCREKGTPAALMSGQIPANIKNRRMKELISTQSLVVDAINRGLVGQTVTVLMDSDSRGRTEWDAPDIDGSVSVIRRGLSSEASAKEEEEKGKRKKSEAVGFVNVRITGANGYQRVGESV